MAQRPPPWGEAMGAAFERTKGFLAGLRRGPFVVAGWLQE